MAPEVNAARHALLWLDDTLTTDYASLDGDRTYVAAPSRPWVIRIRA